jgi:lipoprotein-releasing system permease protein
LNLEFFIAQRCLGKEAGKYISRPIVIITQISVALSLAVMLISVSVVTGFRDGISGKVAGFASHIQIMNYQSNASYETLPLRREQSYLASLNQLPGIAHIQRFSTKPGLIKTKEEVQAIILKGIDSSFDWNFFKQALVSGEIWEASDTLTSEHILISKNIASRLKLSIGDRIGIYFIQNPPRMRRFTVSGIFETGLSEFDERFAITDMSHIQKINGWTADQVSGYEIFLQNFRDIDNMMPSILKTIESNLHPEDEALQVIKITDRYNQIFDWLNIVDTNVWLILFLMILVSGFNMISGILILILERTRMIGMLKALGTGNRSIRKIFLYQGSFILLKGMAWGNMIGLGLLELQKLTGWFTLNQSQYFLDRVPVNFNLLHILCVNAGSIIIILCFLLLPSLVIARISPDKAIQFN